LGKEGEHEVQQRKLHLVMAFTKKSKKKANDDDEDDDEDSEKGSEGGGHTKAARKQRITRQIRRGSELDGVMTHLKAAPVLDVMSDDDLNLLCNRGFTLHEFAPGAPVTTVGDEREETRVMYVVVGGSVEETRVWKDVKSQAVAETLADRVAKAGRTIIFGMSAPVDDDAPRHVVCTYRTGDVIGEMQLLTGAPHPADTRAGLRGAAIVELSKRDTELVFVNDPKLERTVSRAIASRGVCNASGVNPVGWAGWSTEEFAAAATRVSIDASDPEGLLKAAVDIVGEQRVRGAERRLFKSIERHFYRDELDAYATQMANVPKTVAPAKELWARLRKTFFVERWRRSIHGLDLLRCFTADELRTALRHPRTREHTLDVGKSVTIEGDAKDLRVIVVLSGSLKVYLRSAEVTVDGRTKRASNPLIDASRLSYTGGVTSIGSRSGKRLAIAPKEATHVRVGSVPERGTFGSMQALTGKKWDKTAVCAERDTRILSIPAAAFAVVIGDRPSVTDELARVIAWRRKVEAATADASAAAMEAASRGSSRDEVLAAAAAVVPKPPSQAEIAALAEEIAMFVGC
jgi:CRP-like cAMP-binding protein